MTACCSTISPFWSITLQNEAGVSDDADRVRRRVEESLEHYLKPRLAQLIPEVNDVMDDSRAAAIPVDRDTARVAISFASLLPRFAPLPEISPDPDGEISFD